MKSRIQVNYWGFGVGNDIPYQTDANGKILPVNKEIKYIRIYGKDNNQSRSFHLNEVKIYTSKYNNTGVPKPPSGLNVYRTMNGRNVIDFDEPSIRASYDIQIDNENSTPITIDASPPFSQIVENNDVQQRYRIAVRIDGKKSEYSEWKTVTPLYATASTDGWFNARPPGLASAAINNGQARLSNDVLTANFTTSGNKIKLNALSQNLSNEATPTVNKLFEIKLKDGTLLSDRLNPIDTFQVQRLQEEPSSIKAANRIAGYKIAMPLEYQQNTNRIINVEWSATIRDDSNYIRQNVKIKSIEGDWEIAEIKMVDISMATNGGSISNIGATESRGQILRAGKFFVAQETPLSTYIIGTNGGQTNATMSLATPLVIKKDDVINQASVIGLVQNESQQRRVIQQYIERERAQEHKIFLHANAWGSNCWYQPITAKNATDLIEGFGINMNRDRGAQVDAFVLDDCYDNSDETTNPPRVWDFKTTVNGINQGYTYYKTITDRYDLAMGYWLSPGGGYQKQKNRKAIAERNEGKTITDFTKNAQGDVDYLKLTDPTLYSAFLSAVK
jgi:hypothetical protein